MINIKNSAQIAKMRIAGAVVRDTLLLMEESVRPGITTGELNRIAHKFILSQGATPSFLGYNGYPSSICTSVNEQVVHGIPSDRELKEGDIISVDVGAVKDGWQGDAARTFAVGAISEADKKLIEVTKECFFKGIGQFKAGNRLGDISAAVQEYAESFGYGVVRELVGHGIGREMHEDPEVPNFGRKGHGLRLTEGMVFAIEPMINRGVAGVYMLDDGWTVVTADGLPSAHYENTVALTEKGLEILTL